MINLHSLSKIEISDEILAAMDYFYRQGATSFILTGADYVAGMDAYGGRLNSTAGWGKISWEYVVQQWISNGKHDRSDRLTHVESS